MNDVVTAQLENEHLRKIRSRLLQWEVADKALAPLDDKQTELLDQIDAITNPQHGSTGSAVKNQDKVSIIAISDIEFNCSFLFTMLYYRIV